MGCQKRFVILEQAFFAQRRIRASRASPRSLPRASASDRRARLARFLINSRLTVSPRQKQRPRSQIAASGKLAWI